MFKIRYIVLIILFFLFFIPTSSKVGGYYLWFFLLNFILFSLFLKKRFVSDLITYHKVVLGYVIIGCIFLLVSILMSPFQSIIDLNEIIRFFSYLIVYLCVYSYLPDEVSDFRVLSLKLLILVKFFLFVELFIVIIQGNETILGLLDIVWRMEKYWPLRRIGTCDNPNTLSILVTICYSVVFIFDKNKKQLFLYFFISLFIVVLSGSRTGLITFFLLFLLNYIMANKLTINKIFFISISTLVLVFSFYIFLQEYRDDFAYMAEILVLFENGEMNTGSVKTMSIREGIWENALAIFNKSDNSVLLWGMGPAKGTDLHVIDNDYLTFYIKTGFFGIFLNILFWLGSLFYFLRNRQRSFSRVIVSIILIFTIAALTGPVFTSWYLALFFFYFCALATKEINLYKNDKRNYSDIQAD